MTRALRSPLCWAILAFAVAVPWALVGDGTAFGPVVSGLLAGFFLAYAVLGASRRLLPPRADLVLHPALAAALGLVGVFVVPELPRIMDWLRGWAPQPVVAVAPVFGMALVSFAGVVWLLLLARAVAAIPSRDRRELPAPGWEALARGAEARFTAVPMTRRAYGWVLVAVGAVLVIALGAVFVFAEPVLWWWAPKLVLLVLGIGIVLPIVLVARAALRARGREYRVAFVGERIELRAPDERIVLPLRALDELVWCASGDGARLELRAGERRISLLVGIARPLPGLLAGLPPLSRRVRAALAEAGLAEQPTRRGWSGAPSAHPVHRYVRPATP